MAMITNEPISPYVSCIVGVINRSISDGKRRKFSVTNYGDVSTPIENPHLDRNSTKRKTLSATSFDEETNPPNHCNHSIAFAEIPTKFEDHACSTLTDSHQSRGSGDRKTRTTYDKANSNPSVQFDRSCGHYPSASNVNATTVGDDAFRLPAPSLHRKSDECAIYIPEPATVEQKSMSVGKDGGSNKVTRPYYASLKFKRASSQIIYRQHNNVICNDLHSVMYHVACIFV